MNLKKVISIQKELDEAFIKSLPQKINQEEIFQQQILALSVELAEFANEEQSFKYWKKQKKLDKEKTMEEFVDQIHFLTSWAIKFELEEEITPLKLSNNINEQFLHAFEAIVNFKNEKSYEKLLYLYRVILGFMPLLNWTSEEVIEAYIKKAQKNYERIKSGY